MTLAQRKQGLSDAMTDIQRDDLWSLDLNVRALVKGVEDTPFLLEEIREDIDKTINHLLDMKHRVMSASDWTEKSND